MKNQFIRMLFCTAAFTLLLPSTGADAAPISYTYTGAWSSFFSGDFGSTYEATVVMDNGGTSVPNQSFAQADFISATLVSGAYNETTTAADISSWSTNFTSNALGQLGDGWFDASLPNGDSWHFDNDFADENFFDTVSSGSAGYFETHVSNPGSLVPEPTTLTLAALGLFGMGYRRRKRA